MIPRPPQPGYDSPSLRRALGPPAGWVGRVRGPFEAALAALRAGVPLSGDEVRFVAAYVTFPNRVLEAARVGNPEPATAQVAEAVGAAHAALAADADPTRGRLARAVAGVVRPLRSCPARGWPAPAAVLTGPAAALVVVLREAGASGVETVREALAAPSFGPDRARAALAAVRDAVRSVRPAADSLADPRVQALFGMPVGLPFDPAAWCDRWWAPVGAAGHELPRWRTTP
jgi:hypothetical protein